MNQGQGLNGRAISGAAISRFVSARRAPHGDCPPQYGISELCQERGHNGRALAGVSIGGFFFIIKASYGYNPPQSSPPPVSLYF